MAEIKAQVEQATNSFEKAFAAQTTRFESAAAELGRLQTKSIAELQTYVESATRVAKEQIAFAEQIGAEWRKLVLASAKGASELFAPKA